MTTPAETPATAATAEADRPKAERAYIPLANGQMALHESLLIFRAGPALKEFSDSLKGLAEQFQRLRGIALRRDQALTTGEKDALAKVIEQEVRDFESKDVLFQKVYGFRCGGIFSQNRNIYIWQSARLLTPVSDEELGKLKAEKDFKAENIVTLQDKPHLHLSTMSGPPFDDFMRNLQIITARRDNLIKYRNSIANLSAEERPKAEATIKEAEEILTKENDAMRTTYGFTLTRNIVIDFVEAKFFVSLTQEDLQKSQAGAPAAKAPEARKDKPAAKAN
jgi:hypothetical protein